MMISVKRCGFASNRGRPPRGALRRNLSVEAAEVRVRVWPYFIDRGARAWVPIELRRAPELPPMRRSIPDAEPASERRRTNSVRPASLRATAGREGGLGPQGSPGPRPHSHAIAPAGVPTGDDLPEPGRRHRLRDRRTLVVTMLDREPPVRGEIGVRT